MCQAIVKPAANRIARRALALAFAQNPDGAGFAWYDEKSEMVWVQKGFFNFKAFWFAYRPHERENVLIHFRAATHGAVCPENCHPFRVADNVVVAHNGVMYSYTPLGKDDRSDTRIFVDELLTPVISQAIDPVAFVSTPQVLKLIKEVVGAWNKFVFLTPKGFHFVNEYQGDWVNGVWFSSGDPEKKLAWSSQHNDTGIMYGGYGGHQSRKHFKGRQIPPFGTPEYEEYWDNLGYKRDGNAWVPKSNGHDIGAPKITVHDQRSSGGAVDEEAVDEGDDDINSDAAIRARMRKGLEPDNGSRPRDPETAGKSLQLALGSGESDAPTSEEDAPVKPWQAWLGAQNDLNSTVGEELALITHNRLQIEKALKEVPNGSVVQQQLMKSVQDLDERERLAVELAQGGMI